MIDSSHPSVIIIPSHAHIEPCEDQLARNDHEPHFHVPSFAEGVDIMPDFICGGWPRKIIDIEEGKHAHQ